MSQRALLLRTVQRFLAPPIEVALSRKAPANSPVVSSDVMEKGKKVSDEEVKEKMEHEAKRAVEETRGEQAAIDQKAERWVQDPFREGKRKEEERERNEQTEQEESQRAQGESQSGPLEKEDEQCKAKVEQAVSRAMEADADDLVTEMPIGYNNEFESDEDVPLVSADVIRETSPVPEHVVTAVLCPHGYANPEDCPICREEIKEELREILQHLDV